MAIFRSLTFDSINSLDYGIYITGDAVYNAPERVVEMIPIPGKNGALVFDQGRFENIAVSYPAGCFATNQQEFAEKVMAFRNALASRYRYVVITDDYNTDEYRVGLYHSGLDVDFAAYHQAGEFEITFDCKPQRFLKSGADPYEFVTTFSGLLDENSVQLTDENNNDIEGGGTVASTIVNPTLFPSSPLLQITGSGTVTIGDQIITVTDIGSTQTIYVDCESMEIYSLSGGIVAGASSKVSFNKNDFPTIPAGTTGFGYTVSAVQVIPRWWRI